jgi:hypothetical protein
MSIVTATISYTVNSEPAVAATFMPTAGPFNAPLPAGTIVGTITVLPSDWDGSFGPSGDQAGDIAIMPTGTPGLFNVLTVGVQAQGNYNIPVALTP